MPSSSNLKYLVSVVSLSVLLAAAVIFGGWAYSGRQDYKNNTDKKIAKAAQKQELEAKFAEDSKLPHRTYKGSLTYGGVTFNYPRTWSALIEESSSQPINGYFHPDVFPPLDSKTA